MLLNIEKPFCNISKSEKTGNLKEKCSRNDLKIGLTLFGMCTNESQHNETGGIFNNCHFHYRPNMEGSFKISRKSNYTRYSSAESETNLKRLRTNIFFSKISIKDVLALLVVILLAGLSDIANATLRNVNLFIEPPAVRRGQTVTLHCNYILEGAPLYSVKFYRGSLEFFRYTSGEYPSTKFFPYPGIKVDDSVSNATQVVIRSVGFGLSGNFSCEVTADAPLFSTATAHAFMQVVEFPEKRPQLFTENLRYEPGDVLRANCSTQPSRPRAELRFTINNIPVSSGETQYIRTVDNLIASRLSLKLQLQAVHFAVPVSNSHMMNTLSVGGGRNGGIDAVGGLGGGALGVPYNTVNTHGSVAGAPTTTMTTGGLVLRCTAQIGDLYQEYKEIELGTPQRDPVPARVILSSTSSLRNFFESYFSSSSSANSVKVIPCSGRNQILTFFLIIGTITSFHWLEITIFR